MFPKIISTDGWTAPSFHMLGGQLYGSPPLFGLELTILLLIKYLPTGSFCEGVLATLVLLL